ncbi:MAG: hypothetical protein J1G01_04520 [Clostridiales bacterium]|nr:hypothetical protein [Clostridiales bacterium]
MNEQQTLSRFPYDDEIMKYDYNAHRYVLTEQGVLTELGENLGIILNATGDANSSTLAERILKRVSHTVYMYLFRDSQGEAWLEYILAKHPPLRDRVKEMLQAQLLYMLMNGDIGLYSGVNVAKGQIMDIDKLRDRARIAPEVEDIALQTIPGLGYCLKYVGALPCVPYGCYHEGY